MCGRPLLASLSQASTKGQQSKSYRRAQTHAGGTIMNAWLHVCGQCLLPATSSVLSPPAQSMKRASSP